MLGLFWKGTIIQSPAFFSWGLCMYACVRACVLGQRVSGSQCLFLDGHYIVDQAGLGQLPASASQVLGLKVFIAMLGPVFFSFFVSASTSQVLELLACATSALKPSF